MIGIVRHFKVNFKTNRKWMTAKQFNDWVDQYDQAEIDSTNHFTNFIEWDVCLTSDLSRATKTSEIIFKGKTVVSNQLREIEIKAVVNSKIKLHINLWMILGRIAWFFSHKSQSETKYQTLQRAKIIIDKIEEDYPNSKVLVVSHGAFMKVLSKELKCRGYIGELKINPKNGELYLFEKRHESKLEEVDAIIKS
ncbi:histidine phosphatase family protein [Paenibacillus albiflavus]|uniref:Histidine phosphatase family protein n=1 Tax=Paenibacillus albiflavus TaxID=2545760 RepID=A0A4R4EHA6_9BACL|nr:histidine phosphatase family protein [Paenibacillus albiflavus]TCZ79496.1 histidine phosphatase family protein [Paenibacillus albiflavus]